MAVTSAASLFGEGEKKGKEKKLSPILFSVGFWEGSQPMIPLVWALWSGPTWAESFSFVWSVTDWCGTAGTWKQALHENNGVLENYAVNNFECFVLFQPLVWMGLGSPGKKGKFLLAIKKLMILYCHHKISTYLSVIELKFYSLLFILMLKLENRCHFCPWQHFCV
jgi:hypothetical protein